ncbi:MAG: glycosyltransferase family 2 protein [Bifidobacterium tibiigranuli]|jgi:glycosyltransferase involved in cell wall biosynthesis|uniref:glycosyltransferase family 2 protein n=1 Tax=Bifidobacterium tibiigranuli TaxID=2172043 RepID=UPI0026F22D4E|nr:glycosyltransferase family 2 protein [Bifidobacterium tibiigranuli]MCI1673236.1 glycosyltransferase family 2 protein [Bifidobacterium tibiigranuli]MCI1713519.1 glycosyltransferase family 2 protein [Bifidobacterium tibiigranuli]MCI1834219.1 glycosyltransferase family 2 protein [Bifidobacterium tibiigranuli]
MRQSTRKTISFIVPAFNMDEYLDRCVGSLVAAQSVDDIEVIIVDDGSSDATAQLADAWAAKMPGIVCAIHQPNKGHGGAVNTGVTHARGAYVKVVDADDWVGADALERVLEVLRGQQGSEDPIDLLITDYVYDKVGKRHKHVVRFDNVMQPNARLTWDDLGRFGVSQYLIMHSITYRTDVLRRSGLRLPEHTFYVDFIYSYQPFPQVRTLMYLDVPFYHYFIGRSGQSVQTDVMIRRVDQLQLVNRAMAEATPEPDMVPEGLYRYMIHFLSINSVVTSAFLILSRDSRNYAAKTRLWQRIDTMSPAIGHDVRHKVVSRAINLPGKTGRFIVRQGYRVAERIVGFN